jgi:hypothetical protein
LPSIWAGFEPTSVTFWAVARVPSGYQIIFLTNMQDGPPTRTVNVSPKGVTGIAGTCRTPAEVAFPPGTDFLVPPK